MELQRYPFSFCATVVLDLIAAMEMGELYEEVVNDFLAVDLCPFVVEADDTAAQYSIDDDFTDEGVGGAGWGSAAAREPV